MPYTPPAHTPYQWQDSPSSETPLDAADLMAAEDDLVAYTQAVGTQLGAYTDTETAARQAADAVLAAEIEGATGAVASVNGETGAVTITASSVGADPAGSATTAQSNAEAAASTAIASEATARTAAIAAAQTAAEAASIPTTSLGEASGPAKLGTDGTVGGPSGSSLSPFVVKTTSVPGAPTTGTWVTDQAIVDSNGAVWACTAGGTPGTWVEGASGGGLRVISYSGPPTTGTATTGAVVIDNNGIVWFCVAGGTPGSWIAGATGTGSANAAAYNLGTLPPTVTLQAAASFPMQFGILSSNSTITLPSASAGAKFLLALTENSTGGFTPSLAGTVEYPVGAPIWLLEPNAVNVVELYCWDGVTWEVFPVTSDISPLTATTLQINGLPNSTAGEFRMVGVSNGGAPTSGTFNQYDIVVDFTGGIFHYCTAGGMPGTWAILGTISGSGVSSFNTRQGAVLLTVADVVNTGITPGQIGAAALASPALTGTPTAPTPTSGDNSTKLATTSFVETAVAAGGGLSVGRGATQGLPGNDADGVWLPRHHGYQAWTDSPRFATSSSVLGAPVYLMKVMVPRPMTFSYVNVGVVTAGASLTANDCYGGIYSIAGVLLGSTGDCSGAAYSVTTTAGQTAVAGSGFVANMVGAQYTIASVPTFSVTTTVGSSIVTGSGFISAMIGQQYTIPGVSGLFTVQSVQSATSLTMTTNVPMAVTNAAMSPVFTVQSVQSATSLTMTTNVPAAESAVTMTPISSSSWLSTGIKQTPLATPVTVAGGEDMFVWACLTSTGGTSPTFSALGTGVAGLMNAGCPPSSGMFSSTPSVANQLPSSFVPTSLTQTNKGIWVALS